MESDRTLSSNTKTDTNDNINRIVDAVENLDAITRELCVSAEDNSQKIGDILASVERLSERMDGVQNLVK